MALLFLFFDAENAQRFLAKTGQFDAADLVRPICCHSFEKRAVLMPPFQSITKYFFISFPSRLKNKNVFMVLLTKKLFQGKMELLGPISE